jgi:hypothetical protein
VLFLAPPPELLVEMNKMLPTWFRLFLFCILCAVKLVPR